MDPYVIWELYMFLISGLFGILIGLLFDGFRAFRKVKVHHTIQVAMEDLLFWVLVGCLIFYIMYHYLQGQFRFFLIIGIGCGLVLYEKIISIFVLRLLEGIFWIFCTIIGDLWCLMLFPFRIICGNVIKTLKNIVKSIKIISTNK